MTFGQGLLVGWKLCLSFRKTNWQLGDYPVLVREQKIDVHSSSRLKPQRYLAWIAKWGLNGTGNTPEEAMHDLAARFEDMRIARNSDGKSMPRPGTGVPFQLASSERIQAHANLTDDFIKQVLGLDWALITDESSLWDFHTAKNNDLLNARIETIYGVNVSDINSGNIAEILDRIATKLER